jgi:hypothetical protein
MTKNKKGATNKNTVKCNTEIQEKLNHRHFISSKVEEGPTTSTVGINLIFNKCFNSDFKNKKWNSADVKNLKRPRCSVSSL